MRLIQLYGIHISLVEFKCLGKEECGDLCTQINVPSLEPCRDILLFPKNNLSVKRQASKGQMVRLSEVD